MHRKSNDLLTSKYNVVAVPALLVLELLPPLSHLAGLGGSLNRHMPCEEHSPTNHRNPIANRKIVSSSSSSSSSSTALTSGSRP